MITIREIAKLAGTSRGTVDRVLNERGNVNPKLAQRIRSIAKEHNYQSNLFGRALAYSGKTYKIGVVINSEGNPFFDDVLLGIDETIRKYQGYGFELCLIKIKGYDETEQLRALDRISEEDLSALAITPIDSPVIADRLQKMSIPIVTLNSDLHLDSKIAYIGCDYYNSGCLCGELASMAMPQGGRVSIVTGSFKMWGHNERIRGFEDAVAQNPAIQIVGTVENNDDNTLSRQVTTRILQEQSPDLIYFCAAGTEGGMEALKQMGYPAKVIVVDDIPPMRDQLRDGHILALVTQQPYRQGATMVEILYRWLIAGEKPEHVHNYTENQIVLKNSKP